MAGWVRFSKTAYCCFDLPRTCWCLLKTNALSSLLSAIHACLNSLTRYFRTPAFRYFPRRSDERVGSGGNKYLSERRVIPTVHRATQSMESKLMQGNKDRRVLATVQLSLHLLRVHLCKYVSTVTKSPRMYYSTNSSAQWRDRKVLSRSGRVAHMWNKSRGNDRAYVCNSHVQGIYHISTCLT